MCDCRHRPCGVGRLTRLSTRRAAQRSEWRLACLHAGASQLLLRGLDGCSARHDDVPLFCGLDRLVFLPPRIYCHTTMNWHRGSISSGRPRQPGRAGRSRPWVVRVEASRSGGLQPPLWPRTRANATLLFVSSSLFSKLLSRLNCPRKFQSDRGRGGRVVSGRPANQHRNASRATTS